MKKALKYLSSGKQGRADFSPPIPPEPTQMSSSTPFTTSFPNQSMNTKSSRDVTEGTGRADHSSAAMTNKNNDFYMLSPYNANHSQNYHQPAGG